jgi:DNA-binding response OmpR family regulator
MVLIYAGYEVKTAWSSKEALSILEQEHHDLVVTDFNMPGMKGDELSRVIKERWPTTPVIMLTASAANLRDAEMPLESVDVLLGKPFGIAELAGTIKLLLMSKGSPESSIAPAEAAVTA